LGRRGVSTLQTPFDKRATWWLSRPFVKENDNETSIIRIVPGCHVRVTRYWSIVAAGQAYQTICQESETVESGETVCDQA
jgi:hypothetical protein